MNTGEGKMPEVPDTVLELGLRGLRSYVARDDEDLVMVLEESGPGDDGRAITLEAGIGAALWESIDGAEALAKTATLYAELLRTRAGDTQPMRQT